MFALKGNCNAKIKNSFVLKIDSSSCIHDRKNSFRSLKSQCSAKIENYL